MENNFLKFVEFRDTKNYWSVKNLLFANKHGSFITLKEIIKEENKKIKPYEEPNVTFSILGVNNNIGMFDAYQEEGKKINQPYKIVKNNFFAYNPYRINVGSIGLKSNIQKHDLISPAYVVFSCNNNLDTQFLYILFKTQYMKEQIKIHTTGSVRQNLSFQSLSKIKIPLPPLEVQKEIVEAYEEKINLAGEQEQQAKKLEDSIEQYLIDKLGLTIIENDAKPKNKLHFLDFKDINRWDTHYLLKKQNIFFKSKYQVITFEKIFTELKNGIPERYFEPQGIKYLRVNNIKNSTIVENKIVYTSSIFEKNLISKNTLLITRKGTVGEAALITKSGEYTASSEIFIIKLSNMFHNIHILPKYIVYINNSIIVQLQYKKKSTGAFMPSISQNELKQIKILLPPLNVQNEIVEHIENIKTQIKNLRLEAEKNKKLAKEEFEQKVFTND